MASIDLNAQFDQISDWARSAADNLKGADERTREAS